MWLAKNDVYAHMDTAYIAHVGTDMGVILFRNSAWSRHLLKELVLEASKMEMPDLVRT